MKKSALILLIFTLAMQNTHGQVKWSSVETVYASLISAIGDGSKIAPPITSSRTESRVAYYSPSRQTIFVEEKFLDICATFGPDSLNAIAFILGHELAHFYRGHGWVSTNGLGYVGADQQANWKAMKKDESLHAKDESEADIFSGFYAMVAGYNALPMAEKTLSTVYKIYGIPDTIPGYPSLQERIGIAQNAISKSTELYMLFRTGLYCLATEKEEVAAKIYTYIYNQDYAGAEILNNLAVAEILQGYKMSGAETTYFYPIFISTETQLDPNSRGSEGENHILKGIEYLKIALNKDGQNPTYYVNLACAFTMLNEFVDAKYYLEKAKSKNASKSAVANVEGIIAAKNGDLKAAKKSWKSFKNEDILVAKNYGDKEEKNDPTVQKQVFMQIDEVDLNDADLKRKLNFEVVKLPGLKISYAILENSVVIEVYGGSEINFRYQSFHNSAQFSGTDFNWETVLASQNTVINNSKNFQALSFFNLSGRVSDTEIIKYEF